MPRSKKLKAKATGQPSNPPVSTVAAPVSTAEQSISGTQTTLQASADLDVSLKRQTRSTTKSMNQQPTEVLQVEDDNKIKRGDMKSLKRKNPDVAEEMKDDDLKVAKKVLTMIKRSARPKHDFTQPSAYYAFKSEMIELKYFDIPESVLAKHAPSWKMYLDNEDNDLYKIIKPPYGLFPTYIFDLDKLLAGIVLLERPEELTKLWRLVRHWFFAQEIFPKVSNASNVHILLEAWFLAAHLRIPVLQNNLSEVMHEILTDPKSWHLRGFMRYCKTLDLHGKEIKKCGMLIELGRLSIAFMCRRNVVSFEELPGSTKSSIEVALDIGSSYISSFQKEDFRSVGHFLVKEKKGLYDKDERQNEYEE